MDSKAPEGKPSGPRMTFSNEFVAHTIASQRDAFLKAQGEAYAQKDSDSERYGILLGFLITLIDDRADNLKKIEDLKKNVLGFAEEVQYIDNLYHLTDLSEKMKNSVQEEK